KARLGGSHDAAVEAGIVGGAHTGEFQHLLAGLLVDHVHHVVDGDLSDQAAGFVGHRGGRDVALAEQEGDLVALHVHGDDVDLGIDDVGHLHRPPGGQHAV